MELVGRRGQDRSPTHLRDFRYFYLRSFSQMYRRGFQRGKRRKCRSMKNPIRFPLWPSGESGQAVCGALCAPRRQAARCPQTAAHAYAPLALPLAARSNTAIREVPGGSLDTFSPERKYHAPYALLLRRKTDSAGAPKASIGAGDTFSIIHCQLSIIH